MKRVTIKEVARAAGVSPQTVSRVVNDHPDVAPETRARVNEAIDRLDYRPSALARSLIQQRSYTLGVVTAGLIYVGPARALNGITGRAAELGYTLLLKELTDVSVSQAPAIMESLLAHQVDGVIWAVPEVGGNHESFRRPAFAPRVPTVFLSSAPCPGGVVFAIDNYTGARQLTEHMLATGHRHIGHIAGPQDWWEARERKRGWDEALAAAGLPPDERRWLEGRWSPRSGAECCRQLLDRFPEMDALFAANDQMALGALSVAHDRGLAVPGSLAVAGFDDIPEAQFFWPSLTTVSQDHHQLGALAVERVIAMIEDARAGLPAGSSQTVLVAPHLMIRASA